MRTRADVLPVASFVDQRVPWPPRGRLFTVPAAGDASRAAWERRFGAFGAPAEMRYWRTVLSRQLAWAL